MHIKLHHIPLFLFFLLSSGLLEAQITIGSTITPKEGALLDLKENNETVNSTKGFGLPRLYLTDQSSLTDISGNPDPVSHTGLTIYNLTRDVCAKPYALYEGIYVWEGDLWRSHTPPINKTHTYVVDWEGNIYPTRRFGTAGTWMLENLRVKSYADGTTLNPGYDGVSEDAPQWMYPYPEPDSSNKFFGLDPTYFNMMPAMGLMYNWSAATKGQNDEVEEQAQQPGSPGPNEVETKYGHIQGICPDGWHLPSDREWNLLEEEIANNPELYSTNSGTQWNNGFASGTQGNNDWATSSNEQMYRPADNSANGHGVSMKSPCELPGNTEGSTGGKSQSSLQGGFNVLLVGNSKYSGSQTLPDAYGSYTGFWTSSTSAVIAGGPQSPLKQSWTRIFNYSGHSFSSAVARMVAPRRVHYPVRCKKDDI